MAELESGGASAPADAPAIDTTPAAVGAAPEAPAAESAPPSIDDTLNAAWDKAQTGNERDESGRFKSADPKPQDSAVQPPKESVEPEPVVPPAPAIDAPQSWTAEAKAYWASLPPDAQRYIAQREGEAHKAITSYGDRLKAYEPIDQVITRYKSDLDRRGIQPAQALATLFEAQATLDRNPIDGLIAIGLTYGIDLRPLLSGQAASIPPADPRVGQLEQRLTQLQQQTEQQLRAQQEAQAAADAALVQEFAKDKPHFEEVRVLMASLMKDGHAESLQAAYDMAVNASPTVRARIQEDQRKAAEEKRKADEAKRLEELKAKAADAAKSAKLNVKSGTAHPNPKTMDDTLAEMAKRLYG